jgi:hypothetical protein
MTLPERSKLRIMFNHPGPGILGNFLVDPLITLGLQAKLTELEKGSKPKKKECTLSMGVTCHIFHSSLPRGLCVCSTPPSDRVAWLASPLAAAATRNAKHFQVPVNTSMDVFVPHA